MYVVSGEGDVKLLEVGSGGGWTSQMYLMPQNVHLKMTNFMLCVFYYNYLLYTK